MAAACSVPKGSRTLNTSTGPITTSGGEWSASRVPVPRTGTSADVEGRPCQLQRWTTIPEHALEDALSVVRIRAPESWVTLWSNRYTVEEVAALAPRLRRVDPDLVRDLKLAAWEWMRKFEEGA
jgi:hypothetical protein